MSKYQFRDPRGDETDPFGVETGTDNPFTDQAREDRADSADNVYATGVEGAIQAEPMQYETTLPSRASTVLVFAILGGSTTLIGVLMTAGGMGAGWDASIYFSVPVLFVGLAAALPAWVMGGSDLRAIRAGAMEESALRLTRFGTRLGMVSVIVGCLPALVNFVRLIFWFFTL